MDKRRGVSVGAYVPGFTLLAGVLSILVIVAHLPTETLIVLAIPILLAALAYPRPIYLALLGISWLINIVVVYLTRADTLAMLLNSALGTVLTIFVAETIGGLIARRRQSEQALRASEERYRSLFARNLAGVYRSTPEGRMLDCNDAMARIFGYTSREELVGRQMQDVYPSPGERDMFLARLRAQGSVTNFEIRLRRRDGTPIWVLENVTLLEQGGGAPILEGTQFDITARKEAEEALRESERRFRELMENVELVAVMLDAAGNITFCNDFLLRLTGWDRATLLGRNWFDLMLPAGRRADVLQTFHTLTAGTHEPSHYENPIITRSGEPRLISWNNTVLRDPGGAIIGTSSIGEDITDRKRAEAQVRLQAKALEAAANAIVITDWRGRITWVNAAFTRMTGYSSKDALGQPLSAFHAPGNDPTIYHAMNDTMRAGRTWQGELISRRKDGSWYTEEQTITPVRDGQGQITHFISIKQDTHARRQNEERLRYLASHDALTGLLNRYALQGALEEAVAHARQGPGSTLLLLDLDSFKLVNDTLGHAAGDQLLVTLAQLLTQQLGPGSRLARLGGDEFAVLLDSTSLDAAREVAERLRDTVHTAHFTVNGRHFMLGLSIGVVPVDGRQSPQALLAQADIAMYTAKDQGRNRVVVYHPEESSLSALSEAHQWVSRIRQALNEDRFLLYFQPIVRLSDGQVAHYEALLRMRDASGEIVLPGAFIAAAERFGLIPALDSWLVRQAVRVLHDHPHIHLFINLSGRSRNDEGLMELIESQLREQGVSPARLGFELTETAAVQDLMQAERWITRLKALGCRFALDDFGVGFTSFAYLRSLPVDQIKIDGSFIRAVDHDAGSRAIVRAMHTLAQSLGKETVAEFVENPRILQIVQEMGITYGQGFYLGPPVATLPALAPVPLSIDDILTDVSRH